VRNFLHGAATLFGPTAVDHDSQALRMGDRKTLVRAYPAAPDFYQLEEAAGTSAERIGSISPYLGRRTILRVDRLDPSKNQLMGFEAFRELLHEEPERRLDTRFLACLIPSRTDIAVYRDYRDAVFRVVGVGAGAYEELARWLIPVTAGDVVETARALSQGLSLRPETRRANQHAAREYLRQNDLCRWITAQLEDLVGARVPAV